MTLNAQIITNNQNLPNDSKLLDGWVADIAQMKPDQLAALTNSTVNSASCRAGLGRYAAILSLRFCCRGARREGRAGGSASLEVAAGEDLPPFHRHSPLLSLPRLFRTRLETIPVDGPYLRADPICRSRWQERLAQKPGLNVGVVWAGVVVTPRNPQRSIAAERLAPLSGVPGVNFISLQKYHPGADRTPPPAALHMTDWTDELKDFSDTAALVDALDLIIAVDTAVAHLAGALGKPIWLLNRFFPCWRWLSEGEDSPWYPTLRQFRQPRLDDWDSVMVAVRNSLELHATVTEKPR